MIVVAGRLGWWRAQIGIYTVNGEKPDLSGGLRPTKQIALHSVNGHLWHGFYGTTQIGVLDMNYDSFTA